ncbi:MAG: CBS domain-containing protein, partial [Bacilli bacterium]
MSLLQKKKQGFTYEMSVMRMLDQIDREPLRAFLDELQPYDKAKLFLTLPIKYHISYLSFLSRQELAEILEELDLNDQSKLIERIGPEKASKVLNLMSNDDAADLLAQLEDENAEELLTAMEFGEAEKIKELMTHHPDTAGGIMTSEYVWIYSHYTASETIEKIREIAPTAEIIYYIYVINKKNRKLVGVVSIRDLLLAGP